MIRVAESLQQALDQPDLCRLNDISLLGESVSEAVLLEEEPQARPRLLYQVRRKRTAGDLARRQFQECRLQGTPWQQGTRTEEAVLEDLPKVLRQLVVRKLPLVHLPSARLWIPGTIDEVLHQAFAMWT